MSNSVFQSVIVQLRDITDRSFGVIDTEGCVVSCTDMSILGERWTDAALKVANAADSIVTFGQRSFKAILGNSNVLEYAVFCSGDDEMARSFCQMAYIALNDAKTFYEEKHDRGTFVKNIIMDNILPGDIYAKARELHFVSDVQRVVLLIRVTSGNDISAYDVVSGLFPDKQKDFVFNISETDTVLVKEIKPDNNTRDMEKLAASIVDTLQGDHYIKAVVGIGTPIGNIKDLASSFKEAQIAMEVGKVFDTERQVISYDHLGIARLIYQLPTTLCEAFLREVFKQESIDSLDAETLFTIQRFFENNLNVSETSRGLFVHRNTLVYRLEKIRKLTGLDLRNFDDAIVFKVALMVKKYLSANPAKY